MGRVARAPTEEGRPNMAPHSTHVVAWLLSMMMAASGIPMGYEYPVPEVPFIEGAQVSTTPAPDCVPGDLQDNPYYASLLEMGVPLCPSEYDDYDPNDIPEDQAKPEEVTEGYNYPVPENPLVLPTKPPLPECVPVGEEQLGDNPYFLEQGVPLCPEVLPVYTEAPVEEYDDYDPNDIPEDQAKPEELPSYTEAPPVVEYDDYDPNDIPEDQAAPEEVTEGYNYPVPENPLVLPSPADDLPGYSPETEVVEYDDYDPNDIPEDQAAPTGYNYPVLENPLQLPSRARKAKLVVTDEEEQVTIGLTHLDTDTYDPGNYDHNSPDYLEEVDDEDEERSGGEVIRQGGVSLTGPGHVISFHVPEDHFEMMKKQGVVMREDFGTKKHVDPFSSLLGGELLPPVLKVMQKNKDKQKSSKLIKSQKDSINELKSSPLDGSKRKNGEVHRRFNNGKNRKNKRTKNKNKANKHNRFDKLKST